MTASQIRRGLACTGINECGQFALDDFVEHFTALGRILMPPIRCLLFILLLPSLVLAQPKKSREQKVREDRAKVVADGFWIYNDLPQAFAEAQRAKKPLLVVLRCIPCEECVKLDDELVDQDPVIRPLLDQFVCVRQVSTNGLDLKTFQYDTDQSFAVFMLNADGTIYGRFGTRSHRTEWLEDVSLAGMAKALKAALELHKNYPAQQSDARRQARRADGV